MKRSLCASSLLVLAAAATAQIPNTTTNGTAGSVAVRNSDGSYSGASGAASGATITYSAPGGTTSDSKFTTGANGSIQGKGLGNSSGGDGAPVQRVTGNSSVSGGGAPTYYTVDYSQQIDDGGSPPQSAGGGTYDPWPVKLSDVSGKGPTVDLYFQAGLRQSGAYGATGFNLSPGITGSYEFDAYITTGTVQQNLFSFVVTPTGLSSFSYSATPNFRTVLLDTNPTMKNADDPTASPAARLANGTSFSSSRGLGALLASAINSDGTLSRDLQFGILYTSFVVPATGSPNDEVFSWHADAINNVGPIQATPEPASLLPLGLGAVALLRRRRRA